MRAAAAAAERVARTLGLDDRGINGAKLERINARANVSAKGLKQSAGLMVNYLYDLERVEQSHEDFVNGTVTHARAVSGLI